MLKIIIIESLSCAVDNVLECISKQVCASTTKLTIATCIYLYIYIDNQIVKLRLIYL